ncbi:MAG: hypothetical protein KF857_08590 [Fimbriimonadaceae bacterium]|nr:hypothetical protein [Fimbriimonadaceae bacterium]
MSQPFPDTYKWLREATALDAKMELIGILHEGAPLDSSDIWDVVEEVAYKTVIHLVQHTSLLTTYLMRDHVVFPCSDPDYLEKILQEVPPKAPLNFLPDMHRRIAAAIYFLALKVKRDNFTLFSHAANGFIPNWVKGYEGTISEGRQDADRFPQI